MVSLNIVALMTTTGDNQLNWLEKISKVLKLPSAVYPQVSMLMDRVFEQFERWDRNSPKDNQGNLIHTKIPFGTIKFDSPYLSVQEVVPVYLYNHSDDPGSLAHFDLTERDINIFGNII